MKQNLIITAAVAQSLVSGIVGIWKNSTHCLKNPAYANGALDEPEEGYEEENPEEWDEAEEREARRVYHKIYLPEFVFEPYRKGQAPVCFSEFMTNEWSDEECRERYKAQLKGLEPGQQVR